MYIVSYHIEFIYLAFHNTAVIVEVPLYKMQIMPHAQAFDNKTILNIHVLQKYD